VGSKVEVTVAERQLTLSNLDKVLYPQTGSTKAEVIDYYTRVADVLLPHLAGRALTVIRFPNGVEGASFFEKNAPNNTPSWVRRVTLPAPGSTKNRATIDYVVVEELATLVWLANLAALELHIHQWRVDAEGRALPADQVVVDLDPGPPAGVRECARVAVRLRDIMRADGLEPVVKTSGSKGMQMTAPLEPTDSAAASEYMRSLARRLEADDPELVVSAMTRALRPGKVFVDWSQNNAAKTTVAPYSLRARATFPASAPLTWDEVESGDLHQFSAAEVLDRLTASGDLYAGALSDANRAPLPAG
jgi:bifunctional non-homologous end joining protein LigD